MDFRAGGHCPSWMSRLILRLSLQPHLGWRYDANGLDAEVEVQQVTFLDLEGLARVPALQRPHLGRPSSRRGPLQKAAKLSCTLPAPRTRSLLPRSGVRVPMPLQGAKPLQGYRHEGFPSWSTGWGKRRRSDGESPTRDGVCVEMSASATCKRKAGECRTWLHSGVRRFSLLETTYYKCVILSVRC